MATRAQTNTKSYDGGMFGLEAEGLRLIAEERIASKVINIGPVVERIVAYLRESGHATGREDDVDLALREAVANAVVHGNGQDPGKFVSIHVVSDSDGGVLLIVRDSGQGFDPSGVSSPVCGSAIQAPNGRGVFLMRELMKDVTFRNGGREVRLRVI